MMAWSKGRSVMKASVKPGTLVSFQGKTAIRWTTAATPEGEIIVRVFSFSKGLYFLKAEDGNFYETPSIQLVK